MADQVEALRSTAEVSTAVELLYDASVTVGASGMNGGGTAPAHTPKRASQTCKNTATGTVYEWWAKAWH